MIANREFEIMDRNALHALQEDRLAKTVRWLWEKSDFYRTLMQERYDDEKSVSLANLSMMPLTRRADLEKEAPYGLLTFPITTVERIHILAGQSGHLAACYTNGDIGKWMELVTRPLLAGGMNVTSIVGMVSDYGVNPDGLALHYVAEIIGATTIPLPANIYRQVEAVKKLSVTALAGSIEDLVQLGHALYGRGNVERVFAVMRAGDEALAEELATLYKGKITKILAVDEVMGAGVAFDCGNGWHIAEDAFFAEIVDADGEPVEDGTCGQLVLTTLVREAMPLIRYATGIEGTLTHETCECGRTTARFHVKKNG